MLCIKNKSVMPITASSVEEGRVCVLVWGAVLTARGDCCSLSYVGMWECTHFHGLGRAGAQSAGFQRNTKECMNGSKSLGLFFVRS